MSEFMFGVGRKPVHYPNRVEAIAKRHGFTFVHCTIPGNGFMTWFAGPNRGFPFDDAHAKAIWTDLDKAGLVRDGRVRHRGEA